MTSDATSLRCAQCGAAHSPGAECEACFHALLAYEYERPVAFGAVHHLTVAAYYLQHPAGYKTEALDFWRELIAESLDGLVTPRDLLKRASQRFGGATRTREEGATPPVWWPNEWPMTVQSVLRPEESPTVEEYIARARKWASATRATLDKCNGRSM